MATIPATDLVAVNPGVLPAGGNAIDIIGVMLTTNTRAPLGQILDFATPANVSSYFGASSFEAQIAPYYFDGFDNSHVKPGQLLVVQYNQGAVAAYMRGGEVASLTIQQLAAINGTLNIIIDGYPRSVSALNLSSATSFTAAATLIAAALNAGGANPNVASFTAAIAASTNAFTATIAGNLMTVTQVTSGTLVAGTTVTGSGVTSGTQITGQISGTTGGVGIYTVNINQVVAASTSMSGTYGTMTVSAVASGTISIGQTIAGSGVTAGTQVTQLGTGGGLTGTYFVNSNTVVSSTSITAAGTPVTVTFDSVSGGFIVTSGVLGAASSMAYATGTTSASLFLTSQTGAVLSQGSAGQTPSAFMNGLIAATTDWATFFTLFDPDYGTANVQKMQFATWNNQQNDQYMYVAWDNDVTPLTLNPDPACMGQLLAAGNYSGTYLHWTPDNITGPTMAAFVSGMAASIDFTQLNGRITFAFKSQTGLVANVTNETIAHNLGGNPQSIGDRGNGYNFYGAYATANQDFVWENRGFVSGPFLWADSYINQIWLNNGLQQAIMELFGSAYSIPYNTAGSAMIEAACLDPIEAAINFGAIRQGIDLSISQTAQVNAAAGLDIADTITAQGFYLQVLEATAQVRAARASPPCTLWYADGQSIQAITLASIDVQ